MMILGLLLGLLQFTIPGHTGANASSLPPNYFAAYTYAKENTTSLSSITTTGANTGGAITLTSGDFVIVFCRGYQPSVSSFTVTSSPSNTWTQLTAQSITSEQIVQASYSNGTAAGSTSFTCTPNAASQYMSVVVLQYHHTMSSFGTQTGTTASAATTFTSGSFSTSAPSLIVFCTSMSSTSTYTTAGSIGSLTTTMRGTSGSNLTSGGDAGCEDASSNASQSSITASMTTNAGSSLYWAGTVATFNY